MLLAYLLFSFTDTSVKWLGLAGIPALQLAFMRFFTHLALSSGPVVRHPQMLVTPRKQMIQLLLRGGLLLISTVANFLALAYLDLTVTAAIMFSAPIMVCALSAPVLGERVGPWRWTAILVGFLGVLLVVRPWSAAFHPAVFFSLTAATAFALFSIMTRQMSGVVSPRVMQVYVGVVGATALLPAAIWMWQSPVTGSDWILLVCVGAFAWGGHHFFNLAHGYAPASALMPFTYSFLIYLTAWGYLVFGTVPDQQTILGAMTISLAGLVIWWRERRGPTGAPPGRGNP